MIQQKSTRADKEPHCQCCGLLCSLAIFVVVSVVALSLCGFFIHLRGIYDKEYTKNTKTRNTAIELYDRVCVNHTMNGTEHHLFESCAKWADDSHMDIYRETMDVVFTDIGTHLTFCGTNESCRWFVSKAIDAFLNSLHWVIVAFTMVVVMAIYKFGPQRMSRNMSDNKIRKELRNGVMIASNPELKYTEEGPEGVIVALQNASHKLDLIGVHPKTKQKLA